MARVVRIRRPGGPSVMTVEDDVVEAPGVGEVGLVQEAVGVNYVDTMVRDGSFPVPLPAILGFEAAGTIDAVGPGADGLRIGDRVAYYFVAGAYATRRTIPARNLVRLPADVTTEQAGIFLAKGLTAWMGLRALHSIGAGQTILVQGASGSVGAILSRWAKDVGAHVIGVAGSTSKLDKVRAGAKHAVSAGDPDFIAKMETWAPDGVDVVYDFVGDAVAPQTMAAIRDGGRIITIGAASGRPAFDPSELARRRIEVRGGGTPQFVTPATVDDATAELFGMLRKGIFRDLQVERYDFEDARKAHEEMADRTVGGIPVLIP